jgi:cytochrome oxidase Cu insertion factor (SCO1/SenC/PrrC family)
VLVLAALAGVAIGVGIAVASSSGGARHAAVSPAPRLSAQERWPAGARAAPEPRLLDQTGRLVTLRAARRVVLLTFLDSRCRSSCPVEGRMLASVAGRLPARLRPELVVVSVDPWADSPASARRFVAKSGWRAPWHWLLGRPAALRPVWSAYDVGVRRTRTDIVHSLVLYVVIGGYERAAYLFPIAPKAVARDIRLLEA